MMKTKIKKLEGTARELEIRLSPEKVKEAYSEIMVEIKRDSALPGFRKGKAPDDIIEKKFKEDALAELKKRLVPEAYQEALLEHKMSPVSFPEIWDVEIDKEGNLNFKVKVDLHPEVKIDKMKGIKVTSERSEVTDTEVSEALEGVRGMYAEYVDVKRAVVKGDFAVCAMEAFVEGKAITKKREETWIQADKAESMLSLGEELVGLSEGDKKTIEVVLPENYPDKSYSGKKAVFEVEVKKIKEKKLPELNDELAAKMGKEKIDDLRHEVRMQLIQRKEDNNRTKMKNQIIAHLLKKTDFELPGTMVNRQIEFLLKKATDDLKQKGVGQKEIDANKDALLEKLKPEARNKIKLYFILDGIAAAENIEVSDNEVEESLKQLAAYYNQSYESVRRYYEDNDLIGGMKEQIREDKTLDLLLDGATIVTK
ncbi:MAG: trigger factor [Candidatus Omnitrophica bacterium]|nr:trigger factor [Candidatus Omnitrophota bacterium]